MNLTRRDVLKLAGAAAISGYLPAFAAEGPPAGYLSYLPVRRNPGGLAEADIVATPALAPIAGTTANLWTYNGTFPGPLLSVREGERVRLRFTNRLNEPTNLHLHGLHVPATVDDPFLMVDPGETVYYELVVPEGSAGTHWYHPHVHGRVARQLFAGLAGPIVVRGPADALPALRRAEEYTLVLKDVTLAAGGVAAHTPFDWMNGKEGELLLVNGALRPRLSPRRSLLRLRLLNASNARYYRLALEDHELFLIASDGGILDRPVARQEILLAPGERAEVLVRLRDGGEFRLLNLRYDRGAAMMGMMGGMGGRGGREADRAPQMLLTITFGGTTRPASLPRRLGELERLDAEGASVERRLVLAEGMMMSFTINGRTFDPNRTDIRGRLGDLELWEIVNRGRMDHPFHLHTYPFQVLARGGVAEPFPAWKDVVNVRPGETVRIAVPLRDFAGRTVFHCHIVEHEDLGMMGVLGV
jgi:FtsP/CotA-like multicopper oxidase with cupredoxin domain